MVTLAAGPRWVVSRLKLDATALWLGLALTALVGCARVQLVPPCSPEVAPPAACLQRWGTDQSTGLVFDSRGRLFASAAPRGDTAPSGVQIVPRPHWPERLWPLDRGGWLGMVVGDPHGRTTELRRWPAPSNPPDLRTSPGQTVASLPSPHVTAAAPNGEVVVAIWLDVDGSTSPEYTVLTAIDARGQTRHRRVIEGRIEDLTISEIGEVAYLIKTADWRPRLVFVDPNGTPLWHKDVEATSLTFVEPGRLIVAGDRTRLRALGPAPLRGRPGRRRRPRDSMLIAVNNTGRVAWRRALPFAPLVRRGAPGHLWLAGSPDEFSYRERGVLVLRVDKSGRVGHRSFIAPRDGKFKPELAGFRTSVRGDLALLVAMEDTYDPHGDNEPSIFYLLHLRAED